MTKATKMETSAERYRRIKAERLKTQELFDFTSPSGMEWKLRKVDLQQFITSGIMPVSLAAKIAEQQKESGNLPATEMANSLTTKELIQSIEFSAKVVRYVAVEPRIVETPTAPDEIGYDEVEVDDFNAILAWAMPGGGEAESLDTFPVESE